MPKQQPKAASEAMPRIWFQAVLDNSVKTLDPWFAGSGFRTNQAKFRSATFDNSSRLAETFLLNTRLQRYDRESPASVLSYFTDEGKLLVSLNGLEADEGLATIDLPPSIDLSLRLSKCIQLRRSRRVFTADAISLSALATLCRAAAGVTGTEEAALRCESPSSVEFKLRSAPSPGGLYAIDLYAVAQSVRGVDSGLYLYQPRKDKLVLIKSQTADHIVDRVVAASAYPDKTMTNSRAALTFLLAARPWKLLRKYGDRGLRYLFIEVGEMTENIHLAAVALGFGTVESASFYDDEMNDALGLDGGTSTIVHMILLGIPAKV